MNKEIRVCKDDCNKSWRLTRHENGVVTLEKIAPGLTEIPCTSLPIYYSLRIPCKKTKDLIADKIPVYHKIEIHPELLADISIWKYLLFGGAAFFVISILRKLWK